MRKKIFDHAIQSQQGAVLIIGLIMLLLLTVIGMSSIRGTGLQERMAGNARDHSLAFQAAEAGLRSAESYLSGPSIKPFSAGAGYHQDLTETDPPHFWLEADWNTKAVTLADDTLAGVGEQPKYAIEHLEISIPPGKYGMAEDQQSIDSMAELEVYRVTARGLGGTKDSESLIQSTFIR